MLKDKFKGEQSKIFLASCSTAKENNSFDISTFWKNKFGEEKGATDKEDEKEEGVPFKNVAQSIYALTGAKVFGTEVDAFFQMPIVNDGKIVSGIYNFLSTPKLVNTLPEGLDVGIRKGVQPPEHVEELGNEEFRKAVMERKYTDWMASILNGMREKFLGIEQDYTKNAPGTQIKIDRPLVDGVEYLQQFGFFEPYKKDRALKKSDLQGITDLELTYVGLELSLCPILVVSENKKAAEDVAHNLYRIGSSFKDKAGLSVSTSEGTEHSTPDKWKIILSAVYTEGEIAAIEKITRKENDGKMPWEIDPSGVYYCFGGSFKKMGK